MVKAFQEYTEPEETNTSSPQRRAPTAGEDEAVVLPLGDNTLTYNLGIPVLIVCTKVSLSYSLESLKCEILHFIHTCCLRNSRIQVVIMTQSNTNVYRIKWCWNFKAERLKVIFTLTYRSAKTIFLTVRTDYDHISCDLLAEAYDCKAAILVPFFSHSRSHLSVCLST